MPETPKKFYLTTPIYYVNARPHIGHAYTTIVADVLARRHRLLGDDTYFLTGTDEHGQKIERSALAAGVPPQQFTDEVSAEFRTLWDRMGLTYDQFIRTTDAAHKRGVQKLFAELQARGHIYLSSYTGQYCVSEEIFVEGPPGTIGPDGRPTETVTEENYFFRLSAFQLPLIDLIESDTLSIAPESRKNEILSFLRGPVPDVLQRLRTKALDADPKASEMQAGAVDIPDVVPQALAEGKLQRAASGNLYISGALRDLSISRSSFTWGISVPGDAKHVIYVWLDALANYMTAVSYGDDSAEAQEKFARLWPADLHIVGKEITRQHCIYWPAFLLAAGLPLPKEIVAHGWLLFEESKMSKSRGNVVRTETILDAFGTEVYAKQFPDSTKREQDLFAADVLRYFLLREIPFGQDGSFSFEALLERYTADLTNGYGNLVSRTFNLISQNFPAGLEKPCAPWICLDRDVFQESDGVPAAPERWSGTNFIRNRFERFEESADRNFWPEMKLRILLAELMLRVTQLDGYISFHKPWSLAKSQQQTDRKKLAEVLYTAAESIRIITALLHPFLPYATASVWLQLGLGSIEEAAAKGELKNLQWGGLKPGTKIGPLSQIFPRADKGLSQIMADMESASASKPAAPTPTPSKLVDEVFNASPAVPLDPTHPAAAPRTGSFSEPSPGLHVGGSAAETTERDGTPSHHEANPSGIFAGSKPDDASPQISIEDFAKIELRVAKVLVAERIPKADKLLRLEVDLGYEQRQILSGIAEWYTPEELIGRRIVVITNLAPRKMRGLESHGMLLAASAPTVEGERPGKPALATFLDSDDLPLGSRLK